MNKNVILYHGSQQILEVPSFPFKKKPHYDFGQGFYCTTDRELAMEWACPVKRDGYVNKYELKTENLKVVDLTKPPYNLLSWFAVLLKSRKFDLRSDLNSKARVYTLSNFSPVISDADVLIGYRADEVYFALIEEFFNSSISLRQLASVFNDKNAGQQVVLLSEKARDSLTFKGYETADSLRYYYSREKRNESVLMDFAERQKVSPALPDDIYIYDIIREVMRNDDPRIQSNLSE
jgi:hypothetical protein